MKRQILISLILLSSVFIVNAQVLYLPGGTGGIGNNTSNSNVGIGITNPSARLETYIATGGSGEPTLPSGAIGLASRVVNYSGDVYGLISTSKVDGLHNLYGLYLNNTYGNTHGTMYGIYQTGDASTINYFAGKTGIGTNNPMSLLDVSNLTGDATLSISSALGLSGKSILQFGTNTAWKIQADPYSNGGKYDFSILYDRNELCGDFSIKNSGGDLNVKLVSALGNNGRTTLNFGTSTAWKIQALPYYPGGKYDFGILYDRNELCGDFYIKNNTQTDFVIKPNGDIGIGTSSPAYKLDVIGTVRAREIKVDLNGADFVFENDYKLMPLNELEKFVKEQKHLPEIVPAKEMEKNGTELGELNSKLLQKIEEMTLYMIEQNKAIEELKQVVKVQSEEIKKLKDASK